MDPMETTPATQTQTDPRSAFLEEKAFRSRTVLIFGSITDAVGGCHVLLVIMGIAVRVLYAGARHRAFVGAERDRNDAVHTGLRDVEHPLGDIEHEAVRPGETVGKFCLRIFAL